MQPGKYGGTYFENEKASYPQAFIGFLKGQRKEALRYLQQDDDAAWSKQLTMGVDWYPSFTIRGQVRKYFFFGQYLEPAYRQRMFDSAKLWTEIDPLRRPNPFWKPPAQRSKPGEGWTPEYHNSWVDVRSTDNLRAMREVAVYLMAEETGNRMTAELYKERLRAYVTALYQTGMGEWDSANYLSHGLTAYLQLYDFAQDPEVKLLAKAHLDWTCTAAAVKYYRGAWAGPNLRDYGNIGPHDGASGEFWHYFGDWPQPAAKPYRDFVHLATSAYRPPAAVVALARKEFPRPVEVLASKPSYDGWTKPGGETVPTYHETTWFGHHTQVGTLPQGHLDPPGMNLNGFRLLAENPRRGVDTLIPFTSLEFNHSHASATNGGDRLAQRNGAVIWLNARPRTSFYFFLPKNAPITDAPGVTFIQLPQTWLALHWIDARPRGHDAAATAKVCGGKKPFPEDQVWRAEAGDGPGGFAMEVGEPETYGDFAAFRKAVLAKPRLDLSRLAQGEAHFQATDGTRVGVKLTTDASLVVFRDGQIHDWQTHADLWAGSGSPVSLGWKQGILRVQAGGYTFEGKLSGGRYSFSNLGP
ncbi:MAG: hypothetical protein B9S29_03520 [Opitutia bacterium Tous-C2FEB]|nr:MAG: hypothetical protein B9S29_03520 [Opitutae bacterium Tous-C2FEB]PAZ02441.1 MAG: hypothetical protein CAK89_05990 [Opitutae bacterium AMD-G3]